MKPHFLSSLIYVLLVILIIPGMTPHMASAADNTSGDSGSSDAGDSGDSSTGAEDTTSDDSTDDPINDFINDLIDDLDDDSTDDGSGDSTDDGSGSSDDGSGDSTNDGSGGSDDGSGDPTDDGSGGSDDGSGGSDDGSGDPTDDGSGGSDDGSRDSTDDGSGDSTDDGSGGSTDGGSDDDSNEGSNGGSGTEISSDSSSISNQDSSSNSSSSISGSSSDSDDSGPSSMGSGISTEPAANIDIKELATRNIVSGYHIEYSFPKNVTCITHIEYDATRTFRKTTTIVEVLKGKSALVPMLPHGEIYKHVNIWIGENAAGLPTSLKNGLVGFRVEKNWIESNNINESLVTLQQYNKGEGWRPLDTEKTGEDERYVYFESETPGYSFFAITEYNETEEIQETQLQKTLRTLSGKENGMNEEPMKAAKMFIAIALPLFMVIAGYAVLKKKI